MKQEIFRGPSVVIQGENTLREVGNQAKKYGKRVLVVTGKNSTKASGVLDELCKILKDSNLEYVVFDEIESDPSVDTVTKGGVLCKQIGAQVVVAIGGGSPLDAAKAIALLATNGEGIETYERQVPENQALPIIAIPTTAGTGSEITRFTVITDTKTKIKMLIGHETLIPKVAILDPTLTVSMPKSVTAATGMDALTHAIEAYTSKLATPFTDLFALKAVELIASNLIRAVHNPEDLEARGNMLKGQMYAGYAFGNASVALVHAMSRPLGAHFGLSHGIANAILLPGILAYNRSTCVNKMKELAKVLGEVVEDISAKEASYKAVAAVKALFEETGLDRRLKNYGVEEEKLTLLAKDAFASGSRLNNPRIATEEEILNLYKEIF
jgi:1,3-propanediol dehydrogenase/alcohol dehydrogenase